MNRVLDYIDSHLDQPLEVDTMAAVANFSAYHFHRVFSAWLGETVGDYVHRRRLAISSSRLAMRPDESILSIALSVGFGSGEAFARAFKRQFGCTPSAWRAAASKRWSEESRLARTRNLDLWNGVRQLQSNPDQTDFNHFSHDDGSSALDAIPRMPIEVIELRPAKVAYMRLFGASGVEVAKFWSETFNPWARAQGLSGRVRYGVVRDDVTVVSANECRYDCCIEVPADFQATGKLGMARLPGGLYAAAKFKGTAAMVCNAWIQVLRDWLPASGYLPDERLYFNRYTSEISVCPESGIFECELCVPIRPL